MLLYGKETWAFTVVLVFIELFLLVAAYNRYKDSRSVQLSSLLSIVYCRLGGSLCLE